VASITIKPIINIVRLESEIAAAIKTISESILIEGAEEGPRLMFVNGRSLTKSKFIIKFSLTHLHPIATGTPPLYKKPKIGIECKAEIK
jgi:hypothetical protein